MDPDNELYSVTCLMRTYAVSKATDEEKTAILSFLSDLTGKSPDALLELL